MTDVKHAAFAEWWVSSGRQDDYDALAEQAAYAAWREAGSRQESAELLEAAQYAASVLERRLNASGLAVDEFGEDALQRLKDAIERAKGTQNAT